MRRTIVVDYQVQTDMLQLEPREKIEKPVRRVNCGDRLVEHIEDAACPLPRGYRSLADMMSAIDQDEIEQLQHHPNRRFDGGRRDHLSVLNPRWGGQKIKPGCVLRDRRFEAD